jgi:hypothetical protein
MPLLNGLISDIHCWLLMATRMPKTTAPRITLKSKDFDPKPLVRPNRRGAQIQCDG